MMHSNRALIVPRVSAWLRGSVMGAAVVVASAANVAALDWQEMGPAPILAGPYTGRTSAVSASPTDRGVIFVAAASGGIWRTTNGGLSWTPLTDDLPAAAMGALVINPFDENVIYAGSGEANYANHSLYGLGLYRSTDHGDTWEILAGDTFAGRTFSKLIVSHADGQVLFASIMHAGGFPARNAGKGHPGVNGPVGVFRSTDGGVTWAHLTNGLPAVAASDVAMDPSDVDILYAAIGDIFGDPNNGVYKSTDGGDTWAKLGGNLPTGAVGRISLAVAPSMPQRVYALITNPSDAFGGGATVLGIWRTDDGGEFWRATIPGSQLQATYGWYLSVVVVDPFDPSKIYAGGVSLVRSMDAGMTYEDVTPPHVDMHGLTFDVIGRLICANDGGVHRTADNGDTWFALNERLGAIQFYPGISLHPTNRDFVLGGTQDNGTNRRESGLDWSHRLGGDGGCTALHPDTPSIMFAEYQGSGNLYRSTDGGRLFRDSSAGISGSDRHCFIPPVVYDPNDSQVLYYGTHRIYRSTNRGVGWVVISGDLTGGPPAAIRSLAVAKSDSQTIYAVTNDGRVQISTNGGFNWTVSLTGVPGWPRLTRELAVDPLDDHVAFLAVAQFGVDQVRMTSDRGQTWTAIDGDLPNIPANAVAVQNDGIGRSVFIGTDNGVYKSCSDGVNWMRIGSKLPNSPVIDLVVDTNFNRLVVATLGRGAWEIDLRGTADADRDGDVDLSDFAGFQGCYSRSVSWLGYDRPSETCLATFDFDLDDDVDLRDFLSVLWRMWGAS